jgi:hypothetical protein
MQTGAVASSEYHREVPWARIHFGDGGKLDLPREVPESEMAAVEKSWREAHCRVEWLRSIGGRLDELLPQTLPMQVHNANARSPFGARSRRNVTP